MSNNCSCGNKYNSPIYPSSNVLGLAITSGLTPGRALIDNLTVAAKNFSREAGNSDVQSRRCGSRRSRTY